MTTVAVSGTNGFRFSSPTQLTDPPFFIFGCPRSGTSLLTAMLGMHPRLAIPRESHLYNGIYPTVCSHGNLDHAATRARVVKEILRTEHIRSWVPAPSLSATLDAINQSDFHGIVDGIMRAWAGALGKPRWGEKTPQHTLCWRTILPAFSGARVVHLIRDGRDVALSYRKAFFGPKHVYPLARRWEQYLSAAEEAREFLGPDRFHQLRYEDLVAHPERELRRICEFLGEEFHAGMLSYHEAPGTSHCEQRNASNLRRPVMSSNAGKWRSEMTPRELRIFEALAGPGLDRYGYVRALDQPRLASWESLSCQYLEHPPRRVSAVLKNRQARRIAIQKVRLHLCFFPRPAGGV
jgi:Sulfotransferase family